MKNLKYILSVLAIFITVLTSAKQINGVVLLADEPVKGARILDANDKVIAQTEKDGTFSVKTDLLVVLVKYDDLQTNFTFAKRGLNQVVLVPSEKDLLKMMDKNPSIAKCDVFMANYPKSEEIARVKVDREKLVFTEAYQLAVQEYDVSKLERYMSEYASGEYAVKAYNTMEAISWQKARLHDSYNSYREYIAKFPESEAAREAAQRLSELEDEE